MSERRLYSSVSVAKPGPGYPGRSAPRHGVVLPLYLFVPPGLGLVGKSGPANFTCVGEKFALNEQKGGNLNGFSVCAMQHEYKVLKTRCT